MRRNTKAGREEKEAWLLHWQTAEKPGRSEKWKLGSRHRNTAVCWCVNTHRRRPDARLSAPLWHSSFLLFFFFFFGAGMSVVIGWGSICLGQECQVFPHKGVREGKPAACSYSLRKCRLSLAHFSLLTGTVQRSESSSLCWAGCVLFLAACFLFALFIFLLIFSCSDVIPSFNFSVVSLKFASLCVCRVASWGLYPAVMGKLSLFTWNNFLWWLICQFYSWLMVIMIYKVRK